MQPEVKLNHFLAVQLGREGGDIALFITLVLKVFLFVSLTTLGTQNFDWLVHEVECPYV